MHYDDPLSWKTRLKFWFAGWMVRFGQLKRIQMTAAELNEMLATNLPMRVPLNFTGGVKGLLKVLQATLHMPKEGSHLHIELLCDFHVEFMGTRLYQAHLLADIQALPRYDPHKRILLPEQISLLGLHLVNDNYALIQSSTELFQKLLPGGLGSLMGVTIGGAMGLLDTMPYADLRRYLSLYLSGSKQKILNYHRDDIEQELLSLAQSGEFHYRLDETLPDEALFARLGKEVKVEDGNLWFLF
ncbi:hypothetical protein P2G88_02535 [Aliiglaciecola sp. CAU 1673]|uniref:hypothetical protein n=1 Tax=Aliiglaciecola sp. CAU 1673 TaxID=3032595 RepID=UPI0023DBB78E|nr:hypothetical protein [Aliiglaciecola sp. CAU 1673]MDF2177120.1 hypothetical protein [Aliiglaciecola sp. CAU 1673]